MFEFGEKNKTAKLTFLVAILNVFLLALPAVNFYYILLSTTTHHNMCVCLFLHYYDNTLTHVGNTFVEDIEAR